MTTYSTRNSKNVPLIKVNHIFFFKNNYFLSTIIQCNKLDPDICGSSSSLIFQKTFLEYIRPSPSGIFNVCRSVGLNYLTRLQVGLVPNSNISFVMIFGTPYSRLWQRYQTTGPFLLHCQNFTSERQILQSTIWEIDFNLLSLNENPVAQTLNGDKRFTDISNTRLYNSVSYWIYIINKKVR